MNEPKSHLNEMDLEHMKLWLSTQENQKLLFLPTRCTFISSDSIIGTLKLSVFSLERFQPLGNFPRKYVNEDKVC